MNSVLAEAFDKSREAVLLCILASSAQCGERDALWLEFAMQNNLSGSNRPELLSWISSRSRHSFSCQPSPGYNEKFRLIRSTCLF